MGLPEPDFEYTETSVVITIRKSKLTEEYLKSLSLNNRQLQTITYILKEGKIDRKVYCSINNVKKSVAHTELNEMVKKGVLNIIGKGRTTHYALRNK